MGDHRFSQVAGEHFTNPDDVLDKYVFSSIREVQNTGIEIRTGYDPHVPVLDEDKCTHCRLCEKVCPYFAIRYDNKILFDDEKCFGCGLCISKCPVKALS